MKLHKTLATVHNAPSPVAFCKIDASIDHNGNAGMGCMVLNTKTTTTDAKICPVNASLPY